MNNNPFNTSTIPLPGVRIGTRLVLPCAIVLGALAIFAWSSWRAWAPLTVVRAVPVVVRTAGSSPSNMLDKPAAESTVSDMRQAATAKVPSARGAVVQAPGWVEPSPFPITASALTSGVVGEVLVLEGDHVEKDQVIARLLDEQARITLRGREAEMKIKASELALVRDELNRKKKLVAGGGVSEGEVARLGMKEISVQAEVDRADSARAEAELALYRAEVRSPVSGVVMERIAAPGSLVGMDASTAAVAQLFDPKNLQVRTDVPLADAGKLRVGQQAHIQFDSLPGQTVRGRVVRLVQQADIAKNTVQAKVLLDNPPEGLVPDMLARVKIFLDDSPASASTQGKNSGATSRTEIAAPEIVLSHTMSQPDGTRVGSVRVVVDARDGVGRVESRDVVCAPAAGDWGAVLSGLRPGDFVVLPESPATTDGQLVRLAEPGEGVDANGVRSNNGGDHANH